MEKDVVQRYIDELASLHWPTRGAVADDQVTIGNLFRGCLLWGAVGDALGRPVEGWTPSDIREKYGPDGVHEFQKWRGWRNGPVGTITDDTQLTMEIATNLLAMKGRSDPDDFAKQLVGWLPNGRGKGQATTVAVEALASGVAWWDAGQSVNSAGNGAAMRAAPIGLAHFLDPNPDQLIREAILSSIPTHTHPVGVAGAVVIAAATAWLIRARLTQESRFDARSFVEFVSAAIDGIELEPTRERKPGSTDTRLIERIRELPDLLTWPDPTKVFAYTYNGAFALESVPAALYCFLRTPDDPRAVVLTAVNAAHDADSVASMAGNLAGAWNGANSLQTSSPRWWEELEYRDELIRLAEGLAGLTPAIL